MRWPPGKMGTWNPRPSGGHHTNMLWKYRCCASCIPRWTCARVPAKISAIPAARQTIVSFNDVKMSTILCSIFLRPGSKCHSERSEESQVISAAEKRPEMFRFAQHDNHL